MTTKEFENETLELIEKIKKVTEGSPKTVIMCALGMIRTEITQQATEEAMLLGACDRTN